MTVYRITSSDNRVYKVWAEDAMDALFHARQLASDSGFPSTSFASVTPWV